MSTAVRKARKRAGVQFVKVPKVGTPVEQRPWFTAMFPGAKGTRNSDRMMPRSAKKRERALAARGIGTDSK